MRETTSFRIVANKEYVKEPYYDVLIDQYYSMGDILVNINGTAAINDTL
jgi:hypothetical protein